MTCCCQVGKSLMEQSWYPRGHLGVRRRYERKPSSINSRLKYVKFRGLNFYKGGENVTPKNLYRYKLGKIIMTGICIGISY